MRVWAFKLIGALLLSYAVVSVVHDILSNLARILPK